MSILYLGSDPCRLADKLADNLDEHARTGDFFVPTTVVVPNRYLRKWLRLHIARKHGVAANLTFHYLETSLWQLLQELDPAANVAPPEAIDDNTYRLMVLAVLLEEKDKDLAPLRRYLQMEEPTLTRLTCRRAWYLADRLGLLIRDYEYDRQDALIQRWLKQEFGLGNANEFQKMMERAQRALFTHITREPDGKRALLNRLGENTLKTFPQYAMECMMQGKSQTGLLRGSTRRTVHFFGFTHVNELHCRTIAWLGRFFDIRWYHPNALSSRLESDTDGDAVQQLAQGLRQFNDAEVTDPGRELLRLWGRAAAESLDILKNWPFETENLLGGEAAKRTRRTSVLTELREQLLGAAASKASVEQDTSLQIVGCPGIVREVETVYDCIVHNLQRDATLRQTDFAVLVTDMSKYRAALQAVFERPPRRLQYNLVDFSAAGTSTFGQAVLGMLDLALESFSRSRVFGVILNPCFLARLGVDRGEAMNWLEWAESLGIYQGWDADEKHQQGYARSPLYCWRLGLQRLRLGRFMDVTDAAADGAARRFGHVIPFADLASTEREHLDAFCRAVEGLLPTLTRMRTTVMNGARWSHTLERLVNEFLDVPEDRLEEAQVKDALLAAFAKLQRWDAMHDARHKSAGLPLALVREYVQSQLEVLEGNRGDFLVGGVTIAALAPMRPIPFPIVCVLGLGEDLFPGSNAVSSFDLRGAQRLPGDIRPAEQRLYDFLATVLSAQQKLYLFYSNHDLQKDQPLLPAVPLLQLQRYLNQHVLKDEFQPIEMPTHADDIRYLDPNQQPAYQDVLVQTRDADRCRAVAVAVANHRLALDEKQQSEWLAKLQTFHTDFSIPPQPREPAMTALTVTLTELKRFLHLPAQASLLRHLRVEDEEAQAIEDDEPLVTPTRAAHQLLRQTLQQVVSSAAHGSVQEALANWKDRFESTYADARLRCQVPEAAFGAIDQASLLAELQERIHGQGQIEAFLLERSNMTFCGPMLIGESLTSLGARLRFPALTLQPGRELPAEAQGIRIVGATQFAWHAPGRLEILVVTTGKEFDGREIHVSMLDPALFHLALLANAEPNADGIASERWLARREVGLHVAHRGGIETWTHPPGSITSTEALAYVIELARDFLDPAQFDLLPLDVLCDKRNKQLQVAMHADFAASIAPAYFHGMLAEIVAEARDNPFGTVRIPALVTMTGATVPADALAKVQRRFRLLDRGPARLRQQPKVSKPRKTAKA